MAAGSRRAAPKTKPNAMYVANRDEPPYDTNGSVTPTTGIIEVAEPIFKIV